MKFLILFLIFKLFTESATVYRSAEVRNLTRTILLDGKLEPFESTEINAPFEGNIVKILEEGTPVKKGQVLFELDAFNVNRDLDRARFEYNLKLKEVTQTKLNAEIERLADAILIDERKTDLFLKEKTLSQKKYSRNPIELRRMQLQTKKTSQMIEFYKEHLNELEKLGKQGALSSTELADERIKFEEYLVNLEQLRLDYENLKDGNPLEIGRAQKNFESAKLKVAHSRKEVQEKQEIRRSDLQVKQDELNELEFKLRDLESRISQSTVTATTDGTFLINSHWIGSGYEAYRAGHLIESGVELGKISSSQELMAHFEVYETDIGLIQIGQSVQFQVIPLGSQWFRGVITKIHPSLGPKPRQKDDLYRLKVVKVEMKVLNVTSEMKPKMTVLAKVEILNKNSLSVDINCVDDETVTSSKGPVKVEIGQYGDKFVEILSGLQPGDTVECLQNQSSQPVQFTNRAQATEETFFTSIDGTGELIAKDETLLTPAFRASIKKIIDSGSQVKKGDVLVLIDTQNLDTELHSKEIELTQKKVELKTEELQAGQELLNLENEITDLHIKLEVESKQIEILSTGENNLEIEKQELHNTRSEIERRFQSLNFQIQSSLKQSGYLKSTEYQKSLEQLKDAEIEKELAELELSLKKSPASKTEHLKQEAKVNSLRKKIDYKTQQLKNKKELQTTKIALAKLKLNLAEFDVKILKEKLSMAEIRAPRDGVFIPGEHYSQSTIIPFKVGDNIGPGTIVGRLIQFNGFLIEGKLDESYFHHLKLNQEVEFYLTGRKNQRFSGKVIHIAPIPRTEGLWWVKQKAPTISIIIDVLGESKSFQPGSTVQYEVKLGAKHKGVTIPLEAVYQEGEAYYVYLKNKQKLLVKLGKQKQNRIEIIEGLAPGTTVLWDGIQ